MNHLKRNSYGDPLCPRCDRRLVIPKLRRTYTGRPASHQKPPFCPGCGWKANRTDRVIRSR